MVTDGDGTAARPCPNDDVRTDRPAASIRLPESRDYRLSVNTAAASAETDAIADLPSSSPSHGHSSSRVLRARHTTPSSLAVVGATGRQPADGFGAAAAVLGLDVVCTGIGYQGSPGTIIIVPYTGSGRRERECVCVCVLRADVCCVRACARAAMTCCARARSPRPSVCAVCACGVCVRGRARVSE